MDIAYILVTSYTFVEIYHMFWETAASILGSPDGSCRSPETSKNIPDYTASHSRRQQPPPIKTIWKSSYEQGISK